MENVFSDEEPSAAPSASAVVGQELLRLVEERDDIVVLSSDMSHVVRDLKERHPERYVELGIAENNTMSVSAGLASTDLIPYVVAMSPFAAIKCAEQMRADITITHLPVRVIGRLSGLAVGYFGASHLAVEDIAIARSLSNLTLATSADEHATAALIRATVDHDGPVYIRVSEGGDPVYSGLPEIEYGRFITVRPGSDATVIATGVAVGFARQAAGILESDGVSLRVLDAAFIKPLDEQAVLAAAAETGAILTVEEHNVTGGLGSAVAEVLARHRVAPAFRIHGLPDADLEVSTPAILLDHYGISPDGIADRIRTLLEEK